MSCPFVVIVEPHPIEAAQHKKKTVAEVQDFGTVQSFTSQYSTVSGDFTKKVENVARTIYYPEKLTGLTTSCCHKQQPVDIFHCGREVAAKSAGFA
jgi:hypothetical protein